MRCPWCGNDPVIIYGSWWECEYCHDCGRLNRGKQQITVRVFQSADLPVTWEELKQNLLQCRPTAGEKGIHGLAETVLYTISHAIVVSDRRLPKDKHMELRSFLEDQEELGGEMSRERIFGGTKWGQVMGEEAGVLTRERVGTFWQGLIEAFPIGELPEALEDLFSQLGELYQYLVTEKDGEEGLEYARALEDLFTDHMERWRLLHPDGAAAAAALRADSMCDLDECGQILLLHSFPEVFQTWSVEERAKLAWKAEVDRQLEAQPELGLAMWRTLLDAAGEQLQTEPELAENLMAPRISCQWIRDRDAVHLDPLLRALREERFARQMFQSACVSNLQQMLLEICCCMGEQSLAQRGIELLRDNPLPQKEWGVSFADCAQSVR